MIIAVQGTRSFTEYNTFMRAMSVALCGIGDDKTIEIWTAGPHKINGFTAAFCNSSENYLKTKGIKISFKSLPADVIATRLAEVKYFAYLCKKNDKVSKLVASAELAGVETGIFKY